ncbi:MAG: MetQ/NlpA family ABC transporter substrate-binding protein [Verrucomicrobia bacterium]|nr:MetQ/NlpA family ABC transporter substrate-binding protein [Verrucomicrobiota bacterium]MBS0637290.1 MetQ/NlpA family ABC transporter substrate-binding protein [Verrucomicrobiota bacterium]
MKQLFFALLLLFTSCAKNDKSLKIAATAVPHMEMLEQIKPDLEKQEINLEIIVVDDYNIPNRALADGEVDANFFQHAPYLASQVKMFNYPITSIAKIHIEPMGVYSKKIKNIQDLKEKAIISLPNDPTNEARALGLLHHNGIIKLDNPDNLHATVLNIVENPKEITFVEMDASMLPRTLQDVDASIIPTNFALQADLKPTIDALLLEDSTSNFANVIAIRIGDENRPELLALKKAMTSPKMHKYILDKYKGAIVPLF